MKIIVVLFEPPYPFGRAPSRWYYVLLRELAKDGHKVVCFCAYENKKEVDETLKFLPPDLVKINFFPFPERRGISHRLKSILSPCSYYFSDDFIMEYKREIKKGYDIIHIEQNWTGMLAADYERTLVNIHHLMCIDLENQIPAGLREKIIRHRMLKREKALLSRYSNIRVMTDRLRDRIVVINPSARVLTLPLAIDDNLYKMVEFKNGSRVFGMIGSLLWAPGYSAAKRLLVDIFPRVKERVKDAKLMIMGWGAEGRFSEYIGREDVIIKGNVDSPEEFFENAGVLVYCPERGSGMKVKIMESMLYGVPVVTNSEGIEGLNVENGKHCFFSDNLDTSVDYIVELLKDDDLRMNLRIEARNLMETEYSPQAIMPRLYRIYGDMLE